jgi:electron transport complex protein RnfD
MSLINPVPNIHNQNSLPNLMRQVLLACVPGILVLWYFFGWGVFYQIILASLTAVISEALFLKLRGRDWRPAINDSSALVTAFLLAIAIPPLSPWWLIVIGTSFSIIFVKQLYGGLGFNPFNPAMAGYVLLLISFPVLMSSWAPSIDMWGQQLGLLDTGSVIFAGMTQVGVSYTELINGFDGYSTATPLDDMKNQIRLELMPSEILAQPAHQLMTTGWMWANLAFLLGGLYMMWKKTIDWHLPAALLIGLAATALLFNLFAPEQYPSALFHLLSGGTMFAAFFIITDPVSASTTPKGRWIFGIGVGVLIWVIRTFGGYPDAIAFAILLMNMAVPTIDFYTRPRIYGEAKGS